jgi:prepilin-type N-terminal cleavage/methylation domain-containing protein
MARSKPNRTRSAFTLIELLIAILIIGILATLVTLGVSKAMTYAKQVATKTEMAQIEQALGVAAIEMGRVPYIPSFLVLAKKFDDYNSFPAGPNLAYAKMSQRLLAQMFPKWATDLGPGVGFPKATWPITNPSGFQILDAEQAFVFFLRGNEGTGFNPKDTDPWLASTSKRWGPYYQFPANRLEPNTDPYPRLKDYWDNPGKHLVVYSQMMVGSTATVSPVGETPSGAPSRQKETANKYYMPKGYQIFSAGKDGAWGNLGYNVTPFNGLVKNADGSEADDQANFSESPLGKPIND